MSEEIRRFIIRNHKTMAGEVRPPQIQTPVFKINKWTSNDLVLSWVNNQSEKMPSVRPKKSSNKLLRFWKLLGPGLVTVPVTWPFRYCHTLRRELHTGFQPYGLLLLPSVDGGYSDVPGSGWSQPGLTIFGSEILSKPVLYIMLLFNFPAIIWNISATLPEWAL